MQKKISKFIIFHMIWAIIGITSETAEWRRRNGDLLAVQHPLSQFKVRSEIQCVLQCLVSRNTPWPCQTVEYNNGTCKLYAANLALEGFAANPAERVWTRSLFTQDWIPIFRAYEGSGLAVYDAWKSNFSEFETGEGISDILSDENIWNLTKKIKLSMSYDGEEVAYITFNASWSTKYDWFSRDRIVESSYANITESVYYPEFPETYSLIGFVSLSFSVTRRLYAHWYHDGCPKDIGWIAVLDQTDGYCDWEKNKTRPAFMYCSGNSPCLYADMDFADAMVIRAKF